MKRKKVVGVCIVLVIVCLLVGKVWWRCELVFGLFSMEETEWGSH